MSRRGAQLVLAITLTVCAVGNPGVKADASHIVVGAWHMDLDPVCDQSSEVGFLLLFFSNGTVEFLHGFGVPLVDTWSLSGDTITFQFPMIGTFTGTVSGNAMVNGTAEYSSPPHGCWTATKVEI